MDVKPNISYSELLDLVSHLPDEKKAMLKLELKAVTPGRSIKRSKKNLLELLLSGPTLSEDQFAAYKLIRKQLNAWRTA